MKKISCQNCEVTFESETREDILSQLYDHYMKEHTEIITTVNAEGKKAWMEKFEKDWSTAEEV